MWTRFNLWWLYVAYEAMKHLDNHSVYGSTPDGSKSLFYAYLSPWISITSIIYAEIRNTNKHDIKNYATVSSCLATLK